jgi:ribosomal protein S18 acetylase RimI-like enzyme
MDAGELVVRPGTVADAVAAGRLHAEQITEGFLSFLGTEFLIRLYRRIVRSRGSFLVVAEQGSDPVGFVAGSADLGHLYRDFLLHDGLAAAAGAAGRLLRGRRRALETLRHGASGGAGTGRGVELLAIAVDPDRRGGGIGRHLVTAFLRQVTADHGRAAYVVVAGDNVAAVSLYRRAGFVGGGEFELHAGRTSLLMQWDDQPPRADAEEAT